MSTSRERFFNTIKHRRPDRVPLDLWARPEVMRQLRDYLGTTDVENALGVDFARVEVADKFPEFERRADQSETGDWPGADQRYIWHDERTFEDAWGVVRRVGEDGKLVGWIGGPLSDASDLDQYRFPDISWLADVTEVTDKTTRLKASDKVVLGEVVMPFKRAWHLRGMEKLLCDMLVNRDFVDKLYDRIYAFETERAIRYARAGVDCIAVMGDIAMEDRLMFGPDLFRGLDVPRMTELISRTRREKPDILFFYHSDGDISEAMDDLIATGFDIINPIQPECMDPYQVKQRWGNKITMWGTISIRTTLPLGTPQSVRKTIHERIRQCGQDGGLVIGPANVIMYDTPAENIVAMYEAAQEFDFNTQ